MLDSSGTLRIRAYTAGGALPVAGATVRIMGADENNRLINYSLTTDIDGLTKAVTLPAPLIEYSMSPTAAEQPYSVYNVEITAPGYLSKKISGLNVFAGVDSIQLINMIPGHNSDSNNVPIGSTNTIIPKYSLD